MEDITDANFVAEEQKDEQQLRPSKLSSFVGQEQIKESLTVYINAAKQREDALDHTLFYGPPGLGKTTLSFIIAEELGVGVRVTSGPMISKSGDLAAILTNLQPKDVLFIDEIHRLPTSVEEVLYSAMEDFRLDIVIGDGPSARTIKIDLPRFTLVGATTRMGLISNPLRSRFGILFPLQFYTQNELMLVVKRCTELYSFAIDEDAAMMIADRARGTPRIAIRLCKRIIDFTMFENLKKVNAKTVEKACVQMGVDSCGLDSSDLRYLKFIATNYSGGPVGVETIAAGLSDDKGSIEETIEPFLLQEGFIERTTRGRVLTNKALLHLKF